MELQTAGHLARVECVNMLVPMSSIFMSEYSKCSARGGAAREKLLYSLNPNKFAVAQTLLAFHRERHEQVLVFSDNLFCLHKVDLQADCYCLRTPPAACDSSCKSRPCCSPSSSCTSLRAPCPPTAALSTAPPSR